MTAISTVARERADVVERPARTRVTRVACRINVDADGKSFGDRVQEAREQRGLTQTQLATLCGLSVQPIRNVEWERGWGVQAETVARIARALGCPMEQLWWGRAARTTPAAPEGS
jgi:DNA-binding XRE family transcriptional regulator